MARSQSPQIPLKFAGSGVMRWEDLPADLRERGREVLATLLRQAAARARPAEIGDDE